MLFCVEEEKKQEKEKADDDADAAEGGLRNKKKRVCEALRSARKHREFGYRLLRSTLLPNGQGVRFATFCESSGFYF